MKYQVLTGMACFIVTAVGLHAQTPTSNARGVTFKNGVHAVAAGNAIILTDTNGHRSVINRPARAPNGLNPIATSQMTCRKLAIWLDTHAAGTSTWNRRVMEYFDRECNLAPP
jgi:hypothetical protein